jgi:hypothetical protein
VSLCVCMCMCACVCVCVCVFMCVCVCVCVCIPEGPVDAVPGPVVFICDIARSILSFILLMESNSIKEKRTRLNMI